MSFSFLLLSFPPLSIFSFFPFLYARELPKIFWLVFFFLSPSFYNKVYGFSSFFRRQPPPEISKSSSPTFVPSPRSRMFSIALTPIFIFVSSIVQNNLNAVSLFPHRRKMIHMSGRVFHVVPLNRRVSVCLVRWPGSGWRCGRRDGAMQI